MRPGDIKDIYDLIAYCRELLADRPEYMSEQDQVPYAAGLVGLFASPKFDDLVKEYNQLSEILDIAEELEIPNVDNTTISWRRIKELVDELDRQTPPNTYLAK